MEFLPIVSPIFAWIFGIMILLGFVVLSLRIHGSDIAPKRKTIKLLLHGFLSLVLLAFILNPVWVSEPGSRPVLVFSTDMAKSEVEVWKDSLRIEKVIADEGFQSNGDSLILLGKDFSKEFLYALRANSVDWIIPEEGSGPDFLSWKGVLVQGELQEIQLSMDLKPGSTLKLFQAGNEIKKNTLDNDRSSFRIEKSVSILGRNEWKILLDADTLGTIRFYVLPNPVIRFQLQTGFPGPEVRTLNRLLIGKGQKVQEDIQLSKNTGLRTESQPLDSVDVFIIDPSQIQDSKIQKQMDRGVSVLLFNLSDPENDIQALNKAFETDFEISGNQSAENREVQNDLEALPFEFKSKITQTRILENSIAIQQVGNSKIGMSLLTETFPLAQAGDSLSYAKIWDQIIADLRPEGTRNWKVDAPLFEKEFYILEFNGTDSTTFSQFKAENLSISQSLINPNSVVLEGFASDSSWQKLVEEIEGYVYSEKEWPMVFAQQKRSKFLQSQTWLISDLETNGIKRSIPFWFMGLVLGLLLGLIWLEPKIET